MSLTDSDLHELKETHLAVKNTAQSHDLGDSMKPDSWLWSALKPEDLSESAEEEWVTEIRHEVKMLEEERCRIEVLHHRTADTWIQIVHVSDVESGASAYAYKMADVYIRLADQCVKEWDKALKKVKENHEEDSHRYLAEDQAARDEKEQIRQEEEATMKDDQIVMEDCRKHKWLPSSPTTEESPI
ncbi:hypothetical protein ARMGADRAFT_1077545 [Armillaria gallica]|uniref:Uncharacterized protein n=1 Tax=Armillaria gallica TaxID=47427 RepID=A0A2H3DX65_ARMGA|nr:hypothetical protein ARMGADRAFT_1077545 [Armillaria gallica]